MEESALARWLLRQHVGTATNVIITQFPAKSLPSPHLANVTFH